LMLKISRKINQQMQKNPLPQKRRNGGSSGNVENNKYIL